MLNRVLSRPFFYSYKRNSQSGPSVKPAKSDVETKSEDCEPTRVTPVPESASNAQTSSPATPKDATPPDGSGRRPRSSTISQRPVIFQPFHDPTKRAPIVLEGLDQPAAETLTKQDTSGSFILVDTSGTANKPEDEEVDEEFTTPVLGEADETLPSSGSSVTDYGVPFLPPSVSPTVASPSHSQESLAFNIPPAQTGMLSDIEETEEPSVPDIAEPKEYSPNPGQSLTVTPEDPKRELSFASFGSSYPSSSPSGDTSTSSEAAVQPQACSALQPTAEAVDESSSARVLAVASMIALPATPSRSSLVDAQVQTSDDAVVNTSDTVVDALPLAYSLQASSVASDISPMDSLQDDKAIQVSVPDSPTDSLDSAPVSSTTAQSLESSMPSLIPALDLVEADTEVSEPDRSPESIAEPALVVTSSQGEVENTSVTPAVVIPPSTHKPSSRPTGAPHTAERPNWALAPDEPSPSPATTVASLPRDEEKNASSCQAAVVPTVFPRRTGAPHTADRPNWALAPDEPPKPRPTRGRQSRGRGRSWARGSNAIPLGPRGRRESGASRPGPSYTREEELIYETGPHNIPEGSPAYVSSAGYGMDQSGPQPATVHVGYGSGRVQAQDGPAQWLEHIDTWLADSPQAPSPASRRFSTASLTASLTPGGHRRMYSETSTRQPTSGHFSQTPSPMSASRAAPRASPYTDIDVERLRRMLRNSGLQENTGRVGDRDPGLRRQPSRNFDSDARGRQQSGGEFKGRDSVRVIYCASPRSRGRTVQVTNHFAPYQPEPEDMIRQPRARYFAPTPPGTQRSTPTSAVPRAFPEARQRADELFTSTPPRGWDHSQSSPSYSFGGRRGSVRSFTSVGVDGDGHGLPARPQSFASPSPRTGRIRRLTAEPMRL